MCELYLDHNQLFLSSKPINPLIMKHIAYYYFDISLETNQSKKFIHYPNYKTAISIYKDSSITFADKSIIARPNQEKKIHSIFTNFHSKCRVTEMIAPYNKIGIVFHPLGLNYFLKDFLSTVITETITENFNYFGSRFYHLLEQVFITNSLEEKVQLLDNFFLSEYVGFNEKRLKQAINLILNKNYSVQNISEKLNISRRTLLRTFKTHLNFSSENYIKNVQFRRALDYFQNSTPKPLLGNLAHEMGYYDQSDFSSHIKSVTGMIPSKFFKTLSNFGDEDTFWTLLN